VPLKLQPNGTATLIIIIIITSDSKHVQTWLKC